MTSLEISEFKTKYQELLDHVAESGDPLLITRGGKPLARILPIAGVPAEDWIGGLAGTATATGDLIGPAVGTEEWNA